MTRLAELTQRVRLARFVDRPNRFVVRCELEDGRRATAHLPNPGRMWELLFAGVKLWLADHGQRNAGGDRSTRYTILAVERDGRPVFMHTHASNEVARRLLDSGRIPGLTDVEVVGAEVRAGRSRFDLLLRRNGREVFGEVKSVTLFGNGLAMFPDAPTTRGRRHLIELAATSRPGARPVVLFLVHTRQVGAFLPDYHTDLEFSRALLTLRRRLHVVAAAVEWRPRLGMPHRVDRLGIDWTYLASEARDRGAYLLIMRIDRERVVHVGGLGRQRFAPGYWTYVGSAMQHLTARLDRHRRLRKRMHWHVDYLRAVATEVKTVPIRASRRLECALADDLVPLMQPGPEGFGSSDCRCRVHLFHQPHNPLHCPEFHKLLQCYRMAAPVPAG